MSYRELLTVLYGLSRTGIHLGLDSIRAASHALGSPHKKLNAVQIAGTNGKGSTVATLDAAVRALRDDRTSLTNMHHAALERARPGAAAEIAKSVIVTLGLDAVGIG
mgnify:CR=1 FL=1